MKYVELQVTTNYSFLRGASHPEELVEMAAAMGYSQMAITDRNSLAGMVRAHAAGKKRGVRIIPGCHISVIDGADVLIYPVSKKGYTSLCKLLTTGNMRTEKGNCIIYKNDVIQTLEEVKVIVVSSFHFDKYKVVDRAWLSDLIFYKQAFKENLYISATRRYNGWDQRFLHRLNEISFQENVTLIATNDVYYHHPVRRELQDILTCIREKCTISEAGFLLYTNAERHIKPAKEMERLFLQYPSAIEGTKIIADSCTFTLDELRYDYPEEITTNNHTPDEELCLRVQEGVEYHYGKQVPEKVRVSLNQELSFIKEMQYAPYFLTVYDLVKFARSKGILCQGRGSAANSAVCFCLGITSVDPAKFDLLFERFLSTARNEPPDIDVDFEHERREEVIQYIYQKYGRDRAAIIATVTQMHQRGAIRDVGKAMGLSLDLIGKLATAINSLGGDSFNIERANALGLNTSDKQLMKTFQLTMQYIGFPRQLGQHTGGFVISRHSLNELCPSLHARMENRTCLEWNKDDIETLGFLKIDILALGMLTCIRKAFELLQLHYQKNYTLANIPQDDVGVYDMICRADTIGVFQIESRAQQSMLPRLKPKCFYDLVIEVAIVRPGPIQGDMVHPYLKRRNGEEKVDYPSPELKAILERTLGIPLFQEQAMKIAIVAAGFTATEADELRRSMATFKVKGQVSRLQEKLITGMIQNGYSKEYAQRVFNQLEGFGSYGFPESHAASFAQLVYVSSYIKHYYPEVFATALLNSQPMGFYQPSQIVSDALRHGVKVLPIDINYSDWNHKLEESQEKYFALRLGFRQIKSIRQSDIELILSKRIKPFQEMGEVIQIGLPQRTLEKLASADVFNSLGYNSREAHWILSVKDTPIGLFKATKNTLLPGESEVQLPQLQIGERVIQDYRNLSLSLTAHPLALLREKMNKLSITRAADYGQFQNGSKITVSGLILVRQRPQTAKGVWFMTLEDETGCSNIVIFKHIVQKYRSVIVSARLIMIEGKLQKEENVTHIIAEKCIDKTTLLNELTQYNIENNFYQKTEAPSPIVRTRDFR
jgi:error-prone DNA polymerase